MPRVLAIANQKGGVGKTTTAINLAASLAVADQRTLLIDGDPQGNTTSGVGLRDERIGLTTYDVMINETPITEAIHAELLFKRLSVLPATPDLAGAEVELVDHPNRERAMRRALEPVRDAYDFILIDCPPSLGLITLNMLAAADALLIPLQCEYYALEGLSQLLHTVQLVQRSVNPKLEVDVVLLTMYDARLNLSRQVAEDARAYFGDRVLRTIIPRNIRLAEAPSYGKPIIQYDVTSVGAQAYMGAAKELLQRYARPTLDSVPKASTTAAASPLSAPLASVDIGQAPSTVQAPEEDPAIDDVTQTSTASATAPTSVAGPTAQTSMSDASASEATAPDVAKIETTTSEVSHREALDEEALAAQDGALSSSSPDVPMADAPPKENPTVETPPANRRMSGAEPPTAPGSPDTFAHTL